MSAKIIKILLAEDDAFLLSMYAEKFRAEHFDVCIADNGLKVLKMAKKEKPDIILLDVMLPKMNGFEVLKSLKQDVETHHIPVILLTNLSQKDDINRAIKLGARDFLIKAHFMPNEVVNKVKEVLAEQ